MRNIKILLGVFIATLITSSLGIYATPLYYYGYVKNETVPSLGGTWETAKFETDYYKNSKQIGYDWLYELSVSKEVNVCVNQYTTSDSTKAYNTTGYKTIAADANEKELSNKNSFAAFIYHNYYYTLQFKSKNLQLGKTTINYADWWIDDRL